MKKLIAALSVLLLSLFSSGLGAKEDDFGHLTGAHKAVTAVINACFSAGIQATADLVNIMKKTMSDKELNDERMKIFLLEYHNTQAKLCLELSALKIKEVADSVKDTSK